MLKRVPIVLLCALGLMAASCNPEKVSHIQSSFPLDIWKQDRGGCSGKRVPLEELFKSNKEEIKGLTINEITDLFGKPDQQLLTNRQQKYYIYFFEAGPHCSDIRNETSARCVALRFSALGVVTELIFQQGRPTQ